jgi:sirohydrochlorin ferrochelatase
MSTTRSRARAQPAVARADWAKAALLLVAHGGEGGETVRRQARRLGRLAAFREVRAAVLSGEPSLASAVAGLRSTTVYVAPFFMSDGHFTRRVIPERLGLTGRVTAVGGRRLLYCRPLGLRPELSDLVLARARAAARKRGIAPAAAALLLIGHGSANDPASQAATERQAARIRGRRVFGATATAYLEQEPRLARVAAGLSAPAIAVGLFAGEGLHAGVDVPALLAAAAATDIHYLGAIGTDPAIAHLIARTVADFDRGRRP